MPGTAAPAPSAAQSTGGAIVGAASMLNPIGAVVGIASGLTAIAGEIIAIKDKKKQQEYTNAINNMSYADQVALNQQMLRTSTTTQRIEVLANAVATVRTAQAVQDSKNANTTMFLILGGGLALIATAFLIKKS